MIGATLITPRCTSPKTHKLKTMGRRLWRAQQHQQHHHGQESEEEERKQNQSTEDNATAPPVEGDDDDDEEERACYIEGLGKIITGVNALLSRDVVSSTMAHLLISQAQGGERFTYSHDFSHISVQNVENDR